MQKAVVKLTNIKSHSNIIKPNYHLNYGKKRITSLIQHGLTCTTLDAITKNVYTGGIFKRIFVDDPKYGIPYISAQHMMTSDPLSNAKIISKKYIPRQEDMTLHKNQILVSCAGTVGNIKLVGEDLDGVIGSQDIIRIIPDEFKAPHGFIYAYIKSPTAFNYIQSYIYGSVVPRIEPNTLSNLPIPNFSKDIINTTHNLILNASNLRNEAYIELNSLKNELTHIIENKYQNLSNKKLKTKTISYNTLSKQEKRFDAAYYSSTGRILYDTIIEDNYETLDKLANIIHPILFGKKQLKGTSQKGNPLYKSSSMMLMSPESDFWLSIKKKDKYSKLKVEESWILVSRTGTVGNVARISERLSGIYIDDHMIRIIPKKEYSGILYLYLTTIFGKNLIIFQKYGTVQDVINSEYIQRIPIPKFLLTEAYITRTNDSVNSVFEKIDKAALYEQEAINLIETEIDSWQN